MTREEVGLWSSTQKSCKSLIILKLNFTANLDGTQTIKYSNFNRYIHVIGYYIIVCLFESDIVDKLKIKRCSISK